METSNLIRSLDSICALNYNQFTTNERFDEFLINYNEIIHALETWAIENQNTYISSKAQELPKIESTEYYGKPARNLLEGFVILVLAAFGGGDGLGMGGPSTRVLRDKLTLISTTCNSIVYVLQHPGMEDLIMSSGNYNK